MESAIMHRIITRLERLLQCMCYALDGENMDRMLATLQNSQSTFITPVRFGIEFADEHRRSRSALARRPDSHSVASYNCSVMLMLSISNAHLQSVGQRIWTSYCWSTDRSFSPGVRWRSNIRPIVSSCGSLLTSSAVRILYTKTNVF